MSKRGEKKKENALRDKAEASTQRRTELFNDLNNYFLLQKKYCASSALLVVEFGLLSQLFYGFTF